MAELYDVHAERIVLGAAVASLGVVNDVAEIIDSSDLFQPAHQAIWTAILDMADQGKPVEPVAVINELRGRGELARVGGGDYIHTCMQEVPLADNAAFYARIVAEKAGWRRLRQSGERTIARTDTPGSSLAEAQEAAHAELTAAIEATPTGGDGDTHDLAEWTRRAVDDLDHPPDPASDVTTPYLDLRDLVTGFEPGELVTVAGRPGIGKSVLAIDQARQTAIHAGLPVLYVSLEMSGKEIATRILAAEAKVPMGWFKQRDLDDESWQKIAAAQHRFSDAPLQISTPQRCMLGVLRARLRAMARTAQARLLIVDHIGLMESDTRSENRQNEIAAYSRGLKQLARQFDIPVMMVSQLNRGPENRPDPVPRLADLRESGSIEQDSDVVVFVHREEAFDRDTPRVGEADLFVAKNRNGGTGKVSVASQLHYGRFVDMQPTPQPSQRPNLRPVGA